MWIDGYNYWYTEGEIKDLLFTKDKKIRELEAQVEASVKIINRLLAIVDEEDKINEIAINVDIDKPYECVRCISCKYAVRNKEGELNPRDIVCSMWCSDGFEAGDYCSRGEEGVYVPDDNCIQDQEE